MGAAKSVLRLVVAAESFVQQAAQIPDHFAGGGSVLQGQRMLRVQWCRRQEILLSKVGEQFFMQHPVCAAWRLRRQSQHVAREHVLPREARDGRWYVLSDWWLVS